VVEVVEEL
jgi:hypothetical protein